MDELVDRLLAAAEPTAACLNPGCPRRVTYRRFGPGVQPSYCSDECRSTASRGRRRLREQWGRLQAALSSETDAETRSLIEQRLKETSWQMERYGQRLLDAPPTRPNRKTKADESLEFTILWFASYLHSSGRWAEVEDFVADLRGTSRP